MFSRGARFREMRVFCLVSSRFCRSGLARESLACDPLRHVLPLIHRESDHRAILEIIARYKSAFRQKSVLRSRSDVCVAF